MVVLPMAGGGNQDDQHNQNNQHIQDNQHN
jgi:hypothetical protein